MSKEYMSEQQEYTIENITRKKVFRRLLGYIWPYKGPFILALFILLLATIADVAGPYLIKIFIDDYLTPRNFEWGSIAVLAGVAIFLQVSAVALNYYQLFSFQKIAQWIIQNMRMDVFGKVQHLGLKFFDQTPGGSLVSRITNDTESIKELYISVLSTFLQSVVLIIGIYGAMFVLDVRLALFFLLILPAILALMVVYRTLSSKVYHLAKRKLSQLNSKLNESLQGMNMIQALRQERRLRREYGRTNDDHFQAQFRNVKLSGLLLRPAVDLLYVFAIILVLSFFGIQVGQSPIEVGVIIAFVTYLDRLFEPVNMMMERLAQFQESLVAAERVFGLLDETRFAPGQEGDQEYPITEGLIQFQNVTFSYDGHTDVLKDISFEAKPGETVALVGHTGSGKSSIINLLMRFYPLKHGEICIDGVPLQSYADEELRKKVGLVLQDPFLFVGDVKQNIRLSNTDMSDEEVVDAAKFVQADSFIQKLPHQYDQPVGEGGATFSSGQRQLLAFARTMALNPKVLVLDEATASVDTETEEAIQVALQKMREGRTTIAIAHRLSTIQDADLILVLHQGEIVERGTHQELLSQGGLYHKMYQLQQGVHVD